MLRQNGEEASAMSTAGCSSSYLKGVSPQSDDLNSATSLIHSFPPEILLKIFRDLKAMEKWSEEDELALRLVPGSISNVCLYWDAVAALAQEFWCIPGRYPIMYVGLTAPNPASWLQRRLERYTSQEGRGVKVTICSSPSQLTSNGPADVALHAFGSRDWEHIERRRVAECIRLILPHVSLLGSLSIIAVFIESLPELYDLVQTDDSAAWEQLRHLAILGTIRRGHQVKNHDTSPALALLRSVAKKTFPELENLTLSGRAFVSFCRSTLQRRFKLQRTFNLTVSHVVAQDGGPTPFCLEELVQFFNSLCSSHAPLKSCSLTDVGVLPSGPRTVWHSCTCQPASLSDSRVDSRFVVKRVAVGVITAMVWAISCHYHNVHASPKFSLIIDDCTAGDDIDITDSTPPLVPYLTVKNIRGSSASLSALLRCFEPRLVRFVDCPAISDDFFLDLGDLRRPDGSLIWHSVTMMCIENQHQVTIDTIRRLMESRIDPQIRYTDHRGSPPPGRARPIEAFQTITSGKRGAITEDGTWEYMGIPRLFEWWLREDPPSFSIAINMPEIGEEYGDI